MAGAFLHSWLERTNLWRGRTSPRVVINAQIATPLAAEFVHKSACLSKKQQLTPGPSRGAIFDCDKPDFILKNGPCGRGGNSMIYIRLRNRQESGFRNYFFTHERLASQYSLLFSRRKTSTFWSNSIRQLTRLLPRIERLRFGQNRGERNA